MALGSADGKVVIDTQLNNKGFVKGVKGLSGQLGGLKSVVTKLGSTIASAFAVRAIVNFGKECIELGSNVAEVQNVVDVAFGDMTYKVEAFADTAIEQFGMSALAAKKTASTYMAMAKGMGVPEAAASDMAITLAGLTGDVASFYNISQELADTKLKSVFTGETETLKDLGIVMTQANLEAYALKQGITKSFDAMSQTEKVALRYNYVLESLSLANGDFARTSDSWANQTRVLSMQWEEFMSIIGQALITVLTPCVKVLNQIVSELISIANAVNTVVSGIFGVQQNASAVSGAIGESVENQNDLTDATAETAKAQKKLLAGFDEINKLGSGDSGEAGGSSALAIAPVEIPTTADVSDSSPVLRFFEKLKEAVQPTVDALGRLWGKVKELGAAFGGDLLARLTSFYNDFLAPVGLWVLGEGLPQFIDLITSGIGLIPMFAAKVNGAIAPLASKVTDAVVTTFMGLVDSVTMIFTDLWSVVIFPTVQKWAVDIVPALLEFVAQVLLTLNTLFTEVKSIFDRVWLEAAKPALDGVVSIWNDAWSSVVDAWEKWGAPIFENVREAIQNTSDTLQNIWETIILPVWGKFMDVVDNLWDNHLRPLWDNFLDFVGVLVDGALDIYNGFILPVIDWFTNKFGPAISGGIGYVVELFGGLFGGIADAVSNIIDALKGVVDFVAGIFTGDWERAWAGLSSIFKGVINGMITFVESFVNFFVRAINKVVDAINTLNFDMPDWLGGGTFGFNIKKLAELKLPRLATGSVVPPNREFMAVLGDNKKETEVVSPLSTMKQALLEALREAGGGETTIVLDGDLAALARVFRPYILKEDKRVGVTIVTK